MRTRLLRLQKGSGAAISARWGNQSSEVGNLSKLSGAFLQYEVRWKGVLSTRIHEKRRGGTKSSVDRRTLGIYGPM